MKIISSPAKLMNIENSNEFLKTTQPHFIEEADLIQTTLKKKSPKYLTELMEISTKLADENWERNQNWTAKPSSKESAPALMAFSGEVYRALDAKSLDESAVKYLQKNFRMLSGLYGLLKPSDRVMLYRLEMGRKFKFDGYKNLDYVNAELSLATFESTCDLGDLQDKLRQIKVNKESNSEILAQELRKFLHPFFKGAYFVDLKLDHMNFSKTVKKLSKENFDDFLRKLWLEVKVKKSDETYYQLHTNIKDSVRNFITNNMPDEIIQDMIDYLES